MSAAEESITPEPCPNCGATLTQRYCGECGQKRIESHDYSLWHFIQHAFHDFTHLDAKIFHSIIPLFARPGEMTKDYLDGRRSRYLAPLQTFIIINILFFFLGSLLHFFSFQTKTYLEHSNDRAVFFVFRAAPLVQAKAQEKKMSVEEVSKELDEHLDHQRRTVLLTLIPLFAVMVMLLEKSAHRRYIEHLIFSIHFFSFWFLLLLGLLLLIHALRLHPNELTFLLAMVVACWFYLTKALRRVYETPLWKRSLDGLLLALTLLFLLFEYRDLLFVTSLAMV